MSYRLETGETLSEGVKRIAYEQAEKAAEQLRLVQRHHDDFEGFAEVVDEAIHDTRKRFKKIRAVLRIVRDEIGAEVYQAENKTYRDAGRALSELRDRYVMVESLDNLSDYFSDQLYKHTFADIRQDLAEAHQAQRRQVFEERQLLCDVLETTEQAQSRIETWPIEQQGFDAIRGGLRRTYKRGYKRMRTAYAEPTPERFHEWRKRVKYHWYHLRILEPLWADVLEEVADQVHEIANLLGDAHDLAVLQQVVVHQPSFAADEPEGQALLGLLNRRRQELERAAQPIGKRVFAEPPKQFIERMQGYWTASAV